MSVFQCLFVTYVVSKIKDAIENEKSGKPAVCGYFRAFLN